MPLLASCLVFAALGAYFLVRAAESGFAWVYFFVVLFGVVMLFAGAVGTIAIGPDVVVPRDMIRISDEGFEQRCGYPSVFVPWSEVAAVSLVRRGRAESVAVTVRDRDLLPRRWERLSSVFASRWLIKAIKVLLSVLTVVVDAASNPFSIPKDVYGVATADMTTHGSFEIRPVAMSVKGAELADLLGQRWRAYCAHLPASRPVPATASLRRSAH